MRPSVRTNGLFPGRAFFREVIGCRTLGTTCSITREASWRRVRHSSTMLAGTSCPSRTRLSSHRGLAGPPQKVLATHTRSLSIWSRKNLSLLSSADSYDHVTFHGVSLHTLNRRCTLTLRCLRWSRSEEVSHTRPPSLSLPLSTCFQPRPTSTERPSIPPSMPLPARTGVRSSKRPKG